MDTGALTIHFSPLVPLPWLVSVVALYFLALVLAGWKNRNGIFLRTILTACFILALINPSLIEEQRKPVKDTAVIVVDKSPSQDFGQRANRTAQALEYLKSELGKYTDLDLRIIESSDSNIATRETRLFENLDKSLADVPQGQRAGVVLLTDGQVHDVPKTDESLKQYGPVTTWLSGEKNEKDRRLVITQAPSYGIVGQSVHMKYKIEDSDNINEDIAAVTINRYDEPPEVIMAPIGEEQTLELSVQHAGQNVFELSVQTVDEELTPINNKAALLVNGVRDRLRVLLVSGQPHAGGRTWRDLLTSDPGVDLVHFTILRDPDKLDATPQNELSLIAFPFQELFETKLYDFDLIIFDQYKLNHILPDFYFHNIVNYVDQGGALLDAGGPSFAGEDSIYQTELSEILPGAPTGEIMRTPYKPMPTKDGLNHPVTEYLEGRNSDPENPQWGHWLRQIGITRKSGDVLLKGINDQPLLILDRVGDGRVAQLASDHIWLWSRGYENGGPYSELLRRIVHWLMKEPELDEKALHADISGHSITLTSRNFKLKDSPVTMTKPDETNEIITMELVDDGLLRQIIKADQLGVYTFENSDKQKAYAVSGDLNPPELSGVRTTPDILKPVADVSGGNVLWMNTQPSPGIKFYTNGRGFGSGNKIPLKQNGAFQVEGVRERPLIPPALLAIGLLLLATLTWWFEGRTKN